MNDVIFVSPRNDGSVVYGLLDWEGIPVMTFIGNEETARNFVDGYGIVWMGGYLEKSL